jgi:hypothetical protein
MNSTRLAEYLDTRGWPTVTATITASEVIREGDVFGPRIVYRYQVDQQIFVDTSHARAPGFGGKRKRFDAAERILEDYPVGDTLTIHYRLDSPEISTLRPGPPWKVYGQLGFGGSLFIAGLFLILIVLFRHEPTQAFSKR